MKPTINISCEPDSCIVTLTCGDNIIEGHGETLSEALYSLASEVELSEYMLTYIEEITGTTI